MKVFIFLAQLLLTFAQTSETTTNETLGFGYVANNTNPLNYKFMPYLEYEETRLSVNAFLQGTNASFFAPNTSICFNNGVNLV